MKKIEFLRLTEKIYDGTATDEEIRLYNAYYNSFQKASGAWEEEQLGNQEEIGTELSAHILEAIRKPHNIRKINWALISAAASVILCLSIVSSYFLLNKSPVQQMVQTSKNDVTPGGNKAILTLANGQKIILSRAKNGLLASQGNTKINKTAEGQLVYNTSESGTGTAIYNTMATPQGGQYRLTLADGTNVWINAASSIKYPTVFAGKDRRVEITGEAYFEVAHNAAKPFRVVCNNQTIEVLGTHFNVNTYTDEPAVRTTLLEGSVKIAPLHGKNGQCILKPGEQAEVTTDRIKITSADIEEAVSWKNGDFVFNGKDIKFIMRSLSRWYQVDIIYQGSTSQELFYAKISRFKNISQVLKMLEKTKAVHFRIEGRRVIVTA